MRDLAKVMREIDRENIRKAAMVKKIPGELRNQKCPCGSGRKAKNCHCDTFKG
ncbi:SEC-C metal-binding domain-containing protein [Tatumella morbirosei]|uniref:SEC-C metal-binding domain-containing protein n=1 Tax=Tatumella morbirosei TaxID=642227 RepID=UPI0009FD5AED